jgi:hypothetical protein
MIQLRRMNPKRMGELVNEIITKESGQFLWFMLVVKSPLDGLTNRARVFDLQRSLRLLPTDFKISTAAFC